MDFVSAVFHKLHLFVSIFFFKQKAAHTYTHSQAHRLIWERVWHQHQTQTMSALHDTGEQHDAWDSLCSHGECEKIVRRYSCQSKHRSKQSDAPRSQFISTMCQSRPEITSTVCRPSDAARRMCGSEGAIFGLETNHKSQGVGNKGRKKTRRQNVHSDAIMIQFRFFCFNYANKFKTRQIFISPSALRTVFIKEAEFQPLSVINHR